jgi:hypothetical protein
VTSTGHVTGLRAVGQPVTGEAVSEFAASPDGTKVAYAQQGCAAPLSAASYAGVIHVMNLTSGAVRSWHNTTSAATPTRVTTQIGALSWTANGRTLIAEYQWKLTNSNADLAVLGLDATSSGGSLQAHSHLLFSQGDHCAVCVYTALTSADGSSLTAVATSSVPPSRAAPGCPGTACGCCSSPWSPGSPAASCTAPPPRTAHTTTGDLYQCFLPTARAQHWLLWNDPEQFGWISGGKLIPLPKAPAGVLAINW